MTQTTATLTLATYNILHPVYAIAQRAPAGILVLPKGRIVSNWLRRAGRVINNLKASGCDIVCLQEASPITLRALVQHFNHVSFAEYPRKTPPQFPSQRAGTALLFKQNTVISAGPPLVLGGHNALARNAAAAIFTHIASGKRILAISIHATGYKPGVSNAAELATSKEAGYLELQSYLAQAEVLKKQVDAVVIAGDFNEDPGEDGKPNSRHDLMRAYGYCSDGNLAASEPSTGRKLDWLYVWGKAPVTVKSVTAPSPHPEASDHLIITTQLHI